MAENLSSSSVYLMPGMSIKIKAPINMKNSHGFYPRTDPIPVNYFPDKDPGGASAFELTRGFIVEDDTIGVINEYDEESLSVVYTHKKPAANAIWFFARTGERALLNVITVPIHDHSTIVHGGPAYGSYFDDDIER